MQIDIMKEHPLLSSWNKSTYWTGFLSVEGSLIRMSLNVPKFPNVRGATLEGDEDTKCICKKIRSDIEDLIESDCSVLEFLGSLQKLIKSSWATVGKTRLETESVNPIFYSTLLTELHQIGFEKVIFVSKNHHEVHIQHLDISGRTHLMKYFLSNQYPQAPLMAEAELPNLPDNFHWPSKIIDANQCFSDKLQIFDAFWGEMENLDRNVRVIDPPNPNRSHYHRRILLEGRIIIHLVVDPIKPRAFPEINISGPHTIVFKLDALVEKRCKNWNEDLTIIENLDTMLEVSCCTEYSDDCGVCFDQELICTVCYLYSFEGEIPDRNCECGANYHNKCLSDLYANDFLTNIKKCVECPGCGADIKLQI